MNQVQKDDLIRSWQNNPKWRETICIRKGGVYNDKMHNILTTKGILLSTKKNTLE